MLNWIVIVGFIYTGGVSADCSNYDTTQCMMPITDFRHELGISDEVAYFPIYKLNSSQLHLYCKYGEDSGLCLDSLSGCEDAQVRLIHGFLDSLKFLCEETLEEYKSHQQCFGKSGVISGLENCDQESLNQFSSFDPNEFGAKDHLCRIMDEDFTCVRQTVEPECGKSAADWEVKYIKKVITPMLEYIGCSSIPQWAIWVMIALSSFIIGVLFKAILIMIAQRRLARARLAERLDDHHFSNALNKCEESMDDPELQPTLPPTMQPPTYEQVGKVV